MCSRHALRPMKLEPQLQKYVAFLGFSPSLLARQHVLRTRRPPFTMAQRSRASSAPGSRTSREQKSSCGKNRGNLWLGKQRETAGRCCSP